MKSREYDFEAYIDNRLICVWVDEVKESEKMHIENRFFFSIKNNDVPELNEMVVFTDSISIRCGNTWGKLNDNLSDTFLKKYEEWQVDKMLTGDNNES